MSMSQYSVYVIELDKAILSSRKFRAKNPNYVTGKPCVYVGKTVRTPEERFQQHKRGYRAARFVKRFGIRLKPRLFAKYNPMTRKQADEMEPELARRLRKRGYAVWQA